MSQQPATKVPKAAQRIWLTRNAPGCAKSIDKEFKKPIAAPIPSLGEEFMRP
jgi:hypothetical protein